LSIPALGDFALAWLVLGGPVFSTGGRAATHAQVPIFDG